MKRILIEHFQSLDNYGTGMMGLVTIQALADRYGADRVEFYCDFESDAVMEEVRGELRGAIRLFRHLPKSAYTHGMRPAWKRRLHRAYHLLLSVDGRRFDRMIVLGGDDFSEYYGRIPATMNLFRKWKSSLVTRVVLLGQTLGPFDAFYNRWAVRLALPRLTIYARDERSAEYLKREFGQRVELSADLALSDLPLQHDTEIEKEILGRYNLEKNNYFTVVVSGGQSGGKYYCPSETEYIGRFREMIERLCKSETLATKKVVLLAHTFGRFGDEPAYLERLYRSLPEELRSKTELVVERILQTRARFILGNGLFTLTGRMHAAVSTLQMGRPAVCLSYSSKFKGVIGDSLQQGDLVIEADDPPLWASGEIVERVTERVGTMLNDYEERCRAIRTRVTQQQRLVEETLNEIAD